jgi:hypothetical protein
MLHDSRTALISFHNVFLSSRPVLEHLKRACTIFIGVITGHGEWLLLEQYVMHLAGKNCQGANTKVVNIEVYGIWMILCS